jgi:hypothetical protein
MEIIKRDISAMNRIQNMQSPLNNFKDKKLGVCKGRSVIFTNALSYMSKTIVRVPEAGIYQPSVYHYDNVLHVASETKQLPD